MAVGTLVQILEEGLTVEILQTASPVALVVDDDDVARLLATESLGRSGFKVRTASDGFEALSLITDDRPDIVLLDVEMPGIDGFTTCERMRAISGCATIPVLMVTGLNDTKSIERAYAVGATDFIVKPVSWSIVWHRLRYMLRYASIVDELAERERSLANAQRIARLGSWERGLPGQAMEWSPELYHILGVGPTSSPPSLEIFLQCVHQQDRARVAAWMLEAASQNHCPMLDHRIVLADGSERIVQQQIETFANSKGVVERLHATLQDVTEQRRAEEKIRKLADFDGLTSLPNRELFKDRLEQALRIAERTQRSLAVLFIDLDDFKRINDTLGHNVGDDLLRAAAARLDDCVRASDTLTLSDLGDGAEVIARLGGDEFTILLTEIYEPEDAAMVAQRILDRLSESFHLAGYEVYVTPSIGISVYPKDGKTSDALVKSADTAMYFAKRAGKNLYQFHDDFVAQATLKRLTMDGLLRQALEKEELSLHYQPQLDLVNGKTDAVEALLRWNNEELGAIPPAEFIPIAEENGLIIPIGEWVLRTACTQAKAWQMQNLTLSRVAVNISVLQFMRHDFVEMVATILSETGLAPETLELEITESLLAKDTKSAIKILWALKEIGVQLSIDDFGTGYSSLGQLKSFPIDRLKIDQSFIQDITSDPDDAAIAIAVINMAHSMDVRVIAEGVETEAQRAFLKRRRCDEIQGYHLSHPIPPDDIPAVLRREEPPAAPSAEDTTQPSLLLVDDDPNILKVMSRALEKDRYHILTARNAAEGFELLAKHDIQVVVSDYQMPGMNGNAFLERVRALHPATTRIILTGEADMRSVIDAVNEASIHKFLEKPIRMEVLREMLREACLTQEKSEVEAVTAYAN